MRLIALRNFDILSKSIIILFCGWSIYLGFFYLLSPLLLTHAELESHAMLMGDHLMHYESPAHQKITDFSIFIALLVMLVIAILLRSQKSQEFQQAIPAQQRIDLVKQVLSGDEKKLLDEVQRSGEITQDSLRFRLNWSRAKISTIISHLDRSGLLQRRREGKTYVVLLAQSFSKQ